MPIDLGKLLIEFANDAVASLLVSITTIDGHATTGVDGSSSGISFSMTLSAVDILSFPPDALEVGFPISRGAVTTDHEELPKETPR